MDFHNMINKLPSDIVTKLKKCPQDPKYHGEGSVFNHIQMVFESCEKYNDIDISISAIFHDLGKLDTLKVFEKDTGIRIQTIGHESYAESYIDKYNSAFSSFDVNWDKVKFICKEHMRCHKYLNGEITKLSKRELFEIHPYADALIKFSKADDEGRIENAKSQPYCIITVGIPGSGKSTWRKAFVSKHPEWKYINPDEIRKQVTGSQSDQSKDALVWRRVYSILTQNLNEGIDTIFDSTAVNTKTQAMIEKTAKAQNAIVLYKFFYCEPETCISRIEKDIEMNVDRSAVPSHVVFSMYERYKQAFERVKEQQENFDAFMVEYPRK